MKRCLLAAAVVIGCNIGVACADYIIIKIDLNKLPGSQGSQQYGPPGSEGMPFPGKGGKGEGMPFPGGKGGDPRGGGVPGGPGGGVRGGPGGGVPGGPGGPGGQPYPPGGGAGGQPYPPGGGVGGQPYPPGGGPPGGQPYPGGQPQQAPAADVEPMWVYAYIEIKVKPKRLEPQQTGFPMTLMQLEHRFTTKKGIIIPYPTDQVPLPFIQVGYFQGPSVAKRFDDKVKAELPKDTKVADVESTKQKILVLAEWALQRGLLKEFKDMIDELRRYESKHPVVVAVDKVQADLKKQLKSDDPAAQPLVK